MYTFVHRPLITEKTLYLASNGVYTFMVDGGARKEQIAAEIAKIYNVNVVGVTTIAMHGKVRRAGKRAKGVHKADWKKAMVQLKAGQKIDAFEVTQQALEEEKAKMVVSSPEGEPMKVEVKKTDLKKTELKKGEAKKTMKKDEPVQN